MDSYHAVPELEELPNVDTVLRSSEIFSFDIVEEFYFCSSLIGVFLVIFNNFESHMSFSFMIQAFEYLAK
jgi:hypothetical protein